MRRGVGPLKKVRRYLEDIDFPAEKQDIVDQLDLIRAPADVMAVVHQLPSKTFKNIDDVMDEAVCC